MLPEQVIRELWGWPPVPCGDARFVLDLNFAGRILDYCPLTLTGDDWRTAWAEAHDAATDKALDAVY